MDLKVFHKVPLENVQQAFERMVERPVVAGETIVTQGEPGDSYFIILSGEAEVWATDPISDETAMVAVLSDADAFGEEALLLGGTQCHRQNEHARAPAGPEQERFRRAAQTKYGGGSERRAGPCAAQPGQREADRLSL